MALQRTEALGLPTFNDDFQCTAAVVLAALLGATAVPGVLPLQSQTFCLFGAGQVSPPVTLSTCCFVTWVLPTASCMQHGLLCVYETPTEQFFIAALCNAAPRQLARFNGSHLVLHAVRGATAQSLGQR